jgi:hypothetical protein
MWTFTYDGSAYCSVVLTSITAAQSFKSASVAQIAGTDVSAAAKIQQIYDPLTGWASGLQVNAALITCEGGAINFTIDGTTPTVTAGTNIGHQLQPGQSYVISGRQNVTAFQCINAVASNGAIVKASMLR